jgi:hypothetical protein
MNAGPWLLEQGLEQQHKNNTFLNGSWMKEGGTSASGTLYNFINE